MTELTEDTGQEAVTTDISDVDTSTAAPVADATATTDADPFESFARERGWSPKEEWRGRPEDWREPKDFISFGMERGRDANREVRELKSTVDRIGRVSEQIMKRTIDEQRRELEERFAGAVEGKNHEEARAVREELSRLDQPQHDPQPVQGVQDFMSRNTWFGQNRAATLVAQGITAQLASQGVSPDEQLRQAEAAVRADFPHLFNAAPAAAKAAPAVSAPTTRTAVASTQAKSFATLPAAAQTAGKDFLKRGMVKNLEDYAKVYYEEQA